MDTHKDHKKHSLTSHREHNPWSQWQHEVGQFFDRFNRNLAPEGDADFYPKIEIQDNEKNFIVCAEIPGMSEKDVQVSLRDNQLIIEGERKSERESEENGTYRSEFSYGSFYRTIPLRDEVKADSVKATYKDGLLRIKLEKTHAGSQNVRKIPITRS
jgi:HSP20 family protein